MTKQETRQVGVGPEGMRSPYEAAWCLNRPHEHRVTWPKVGDTVLYRSNDWFEPIRATVVAVDIGPSDHPCRRIADPWPMVRLKVVPPHPDLKLDISGLAFPGTAPMRPHYIETREARLEGAAGWLPLDWESRYRPPAGENGLIV